MNIIPAAAEHIPQLIQLDPHVAEDELRALVSRHRVLVAMENSEICGWLRWNLFWDNTPFMNMLFVTQPHRGNGFGKAIVMHWENEMQQVGYETVMTSTASDEYAQHFYRKLGYETVGGFTPFGESYELILGKKL